MRSIHRHSRIELCPFALKDYDFSLQSCSYRFAIQGLTAVELHNLPVAVTPETAPTFGLPPVTANIFGDVLLKELGWEYDTIWWYCMVAVALTIALLTVGKFIIIRYVRWISR